METTKTEWATKGERAEIVRHADNLQMIGQFEGKQQEMYIPGEKATAVKRPDNIKPSEGTFEGEEL